MSLLIHNNSVYMGIIQSSIGFVIFLFNLKKYFYYHTDYNRHSIYSLGFSTFLSKKQNHGISYFDFITEKSANYLGEKTTKEESPKQPLICRDINKQALD